MTTTDNINTRTNYLGGSETEGSGHSLSENFEEAVHFMAYYNFFLKPNYFDILHNGQFNS